MSADTPPNYLHAIHQDCAAIRVELEVLKAQHGHLDGCIDGLKEEVRWLRRSLWGMGATVIAGLIGHLVISGVLGS